MTGGTEEAPTPGWDAITAALETLYPGPEPKHFGPVLPYITGGQDPLDGINVYRVEEPVPHWHYVTFGFSELYAKETDLADVSGFGFALTFRLLCGDEVDPPHFAMSFLQNLARYVFQTGNVFEPGHHMELNGPIMQGAETGITAICFARDPRLPEITTPNGKLDFLQVVGVTQDELAAARAWNKEAFLDLLGRHTPWLVTNLNRESILLVPEVSEEIRAGIWRDGSSTNAVVVPEVRFFKFGVLGRKLCWKLGANHVRDLVSVLPGRICHGNPLLLTDGTHGVHLVPGEVPAAKLGSEGLEITLTSDLAERIAAELKSHRGNYTWDQLSNLVVTVEPTEIRDHEGKVVKTVG